MANTITFDYVPATDLNSALVLERAGFKPEEAGTETSFRYRQSQAPRLFLGAYEKDGESLELVGYVCATQTPDTSLTHESMTHHVPGSATICIHSVCVSPSKRGKGIGLALLKEYSARAEQARREGAEAWKQIVLITHNDLIPFYEKAGFEKVGTSSVMHGPLPWFEMRKVLASQPEKLAETLDSQTLPPGILEALQHRRTDLPSSRLISDFPNGLSDALVSDGAGSSQNKFDLLCPRPNCGSTILKKGVGKWVERASMQMEPAGYAQNQHLPPLPTPPETAQWWLITGSPMVFENIGFTRPVQPLASGGRKLKLLTCGECDLGPLGWSEEGATEYWLACSRVSYQA